MDYKQKLIEFNSTKKYKAELSFLLGLIGEETGDVLDFGCGIGTAINYLSERMEARIYGYDVKHYAEDKNNWYVEQKPASKYGHIYFMHSLAHIENPSQTLTNLKDNLLKGGRITVITPNLGWLQEVGITNSDPTVVEHFRPETLKELFVSSGYSVLQQGQFGEIRNGYSERLFIQCALQS